MFDKINNPVVFLGDKKRENYFEGWYFKQTNKDKNHIISLIPGVSFAKGDEHSFIQYVYVNDKDSTNRKIKTGYIRFSLSDFSSEKTPFSVTIGSNKFSKNDISIEIKQNEFNVSGIISFNEITPIKRKLLMPNIMGYFAYFPKMECSHGVISMGHTLSGSLVINGETVDFNGGKGYIEKDWGVSFPKEYIWIQCNNFENKNTGIMFSVADIPFLGTTFKGFLCNLSINNTEYRFATYNNSKIKNLKLQDNKIEITIENKKAKLEITAYITNPGELIAPVKGSMERKIKEEVTGKLKFKLEDKKENRVYEDYGDAAGIEVVKEI